MSERRLITRAEFARRVNRGRSSVTEACQGVLSAAMYGDKLDIAHPVALEWMAARGLDPTTVALAGKPKKKARKAPKKASNGNGTPELPPEPFEAPENPDELLDMTVREVGEQFGTVGELVAWLDVRKMTATIGSIELQNQKKRGDVIDRDLVATHVFGAIEGTNRRLLTDVPRTIAARLYAQAKSGEPIEEAEGTAREIISTTLRVVKAAALATLGTPPAESPPTLQLATELLEFVEAHLDAETFATVLDALAPLEGAAA